MYYHGATLVRSREARRERDPPLVAVGVDRRHDDLLRVVVAGGRGAAADQLPPGREPGDVGVDVEPLAGDRTRVRLLRERELLADREHRHVARRVREERVVLALVEREPRDLPGDR